MVSKTIKNQQIKRFKFWLNQGLQEGIQYQNALFQRICTLDYSQRCRLYQQSRQMAQQGADILITYEAEACHLWVNLQKTIQNH